MKHRKSIWAANARKPKNKKETPHKRQANRGCRSATLDNARAYTQKATNENDMNEQTNERKNQFN